MSRSAVSIWPGSGWTRTLVTASDAVAFFLPMHTATRLAIPVVDRIRTLNPRARLCAYGLYAPLNEALLRSHGVEHILGGEFEDDLVGTLQGTGGAAPSVPPPAATISNGAPRPAVARVTFRVPSRDGLPPLSRYASLQLGGERRVAGYTEASRGCKHRCRHCPIVPVYDGRFRIVPIEIVLEDIRQQVAAGARHITFGDPDFLNGPRHARDLVRAFRREFPGITYDVTIKVEHLLAQPAMIPLLHDTGCLFVTSAVESIDDRVLARLEKGHTRADFEQVASLCRAAGLTLVPTFVAFTPWTTLRGYCELLQAIDALDLVDHVSPVQLVIRLLIPRGSRLLELDDVRAIVGPYSPATLTYPWRHPDPGSGRAAAAARGDGRHSAGRRIVRSCSPASGMRRTPQRVSRRRRASSGRGGRARRFRTSTSPGTVERSRPSEQVALV